MSDLPDFINAILLKGEKPDGTLVNIKVDTDGKLFAILKALYGTEYKDLVCDTNGNLLLNLTAQDLAYLTSRTMYGEAESVYASDTIGINETVTLFTISGKGIVHTSCFYIDASASVDIDMITVTVDGNNIFYDTFENILKYNWVGNSNNIVRLNCYDEVNYVFSLSLGEGVTFESSFALTFEELRAEVVYVSAFATYSLVN